MADVTVRNVEKAYGDTRVIHGIDVQIEDGSFVVLVGPSGCGKSTLLRIIAGLEEVTEGAILIGGQEVNDLNPKERDIAMVFQNYGLYPHMTVAREHGLRAEAVEGAEGGDRRARGQRRRDPGPRMSCWIASRASCPAGSASASRWAGRSCATRSVFLFDEPLSNLDAKLRVQMRAEIKRLHQRLKVTTVYVTHDQIEAMTMADRIVVMHAGVVKQAGTPLELYDRPENLFVAGFIGSPSMNFFDATAGRGALQLSDGQTLPLPAGAALSEGQAVVLGIRPEDLTIAETGLEASIDLVEPTGAEIYVNATLGGKPMTAVFRERHDLQPRPDGSVMAAA